MRKRHSGQSIGVPGSAKDKPLSRSFRSGRLGPCSSSHFQYCAPRIQLPWQFGHLKEVRFDSKSVKTSSNDLHTGQFIKSVYARMLVIKPGAIEKSFLYRARLMAPLTSAVGAAYW